MTRDGLVVENQADGTVRMFPAGKRNRTTPRMPRARPKKYWNGPRTSRTSTRQRKRPSKLRKPPKAKMACTGPAARLELTEEERADPALQPYIQKAEAKADKLDAARAALPKKRVPVKEKVYDAANGKAKSRLHFEKQEKAPPSLKPNPASRPLSGSVAVRSTEKSMRLNTKMWAWRAATRGKNWWSIRPPWSSAAASGTTR